MKVLLIRVGAMERVVASYIGKSHISCLFIPLLLSIYPTFPLLLSIYPISPIYLSHRWGNPQNYVTGTRKEQKLFCQHSVKFVRDVPGDGHIIVFNNGRYVYDCTWYVCVCQCCIYIYIGM